jgi:hypothetical protein
MVLILSVEEAKHFSVVERYIGEELTLVEACERSKGKSSLAC